LKQISTMENVREAYPSLRVPVQMAVGEFSRTIMAVGVPMSSKSEGGYQTFAYGGFFASESENACMGNLDLAKQIAQQDPGSLIGKSFTLSYAASHSNEQEPGFQVQRVDLQCRLSGILERDPSFLPIGGGGPTGVMLPMNLAKTINDEVVTS